MTNLLSHAYLLLLLAVPLTAVEKTPVAVYAGPMSEIGWERAQDQVTLRLYPDHTATLTGTQRHGAGVQSLRWEDRPKVLAGRVDQRTATVAPGIALLDANGSSLWEFQYRDSKALLFGHTIGFAGSLKCLQTNPDAPYVGSTTDATEENTLK